MKYIKQYAVYEAFSTTSLTEDQKIWLDKCAKGGWSLNPSTGLIDVGYGFDCEGQGLKNFKGVAFGRAKGNFYCGSNQLTSLDGAPKTVKGDFDCGYNQLTSLEGAPQSVGESFYCNNNQLTSLVGAPKTVKGNFNCADNQLTSLEGAPQTVDGLFYCASNPVSERTLESIFSLMKNGKSYQQALTEFWPKMDNDDRLLMYKDHSSLTPEEIRRYDALTTVNRIKNYL